MHLDCTKLQKVKISMGEYVDRLLGKVPQEFAEAAPTTASKHLFDTSDDAIELCKERTAVFHHRVAKVLFFSKRTRPDTQLDGTFLRIWV